MSGRRTSEKACIYSVGNLKSLALRMEIPVHVHGFGIFLHNAVGKYPMYMYMVFVFFYTMQ